VAASQCGQASWYSIGPETASGEVMNADALAAAHRTLPFGTMVKVEDLANGRSVVVRINDRGPFVGGRVIDLTRAAAQRLGIIDAGTAPVRLTVLGGGPQLIGCS
jgi:peptidoglycan lytic transglycosylase